jgi:tripartite-type tricarboxylate transporter receptor subunit TctC
VPHKGTGMRLTRRRLLLLAAGAAAAAMVPRGATAYPARPVRIIVGFPAGGVGDITARLIGEALQERLGQTVLVENRPGAGGNVGTEAVARSPADGYTLILSGTNNTSNATLYPNLKFNFLRDLASVGSIMRGPLVMAVHPAFPARTVAEFIAYAKANPGKVNMVSSGNGTSTHLTGELFKMKAGVALQHVPYRGEAPALADLVAGQAQVMFANMPSSIGHVRGGALRALGVTGARRAPALPDVPTVADTVPGYESTAWFGLSAPKQTPAEVIARLNREINQSLADAKLAARIADFGATPMPLTPGEFDRFVAAETEKWAQVVAFSGARIE